MTPPSHRSLPYEPALDGLRGIAVTAVVLYHAGFAWMVGGYLGVSTFFTLSGFLITSLLVTEFERDGRIDLAVFWGRRVRRLLPAAYLALAGVALFGALAADRYQLARLRADGLSALAYATNWWFILSDRGYVDVFASPSPLQHFWSLAIEEQFYLFFPVLVLGILRLSRGRRRQLAAVLAVAAVASIMEMIVLARTDIPTARLYFGTDTRVAELLAGALLALATAGRSPPTSKGGRWAISLAGVIGLAGSAYCWGTLRQDEAALYAGGLALYTLASVAVVAAAVAPGGPVHRLLALAPLRQLGRISYGVYVYHFPIFLWVTPERTGLADLPTFMLRVLATLALAGLSFRLLEWPVRTRRLLGGRYAWFAIPAAALPIALGFVGVTTNADPAASPMAVLDLSTAAPPGGWAPDAVRVLVVGDSVAGTIAAGLQRWGRTTRRMNVRAVTATGCGLAPLGIVRTRDRATGDRDRCEQWTATLAAEVRRDDPDVVVVYSAGWDMVERRLPGWGRARGPGDPVYARWLRERYAETIGAFAVRGASIVWLQAMCTRPRRLGEELFDPELVRTFNRQVLEPLAGMRPGEVVVVDLYGAVCPRHRFTNVLDGVPDVRPDGIHFSDAGADWVGRWLGPQVLRIARERARATRP